MYEAWQAQQKAQKDEDRKAKSAAAAALQSYRRDGLSEEETKLAALREQERLQKLQAEQKLRDYRGTMSEEEAKLAALRQEELRKKQLQEEQLRNNGVVTANPVGVHDSLRGMENSGAVSAMAAQYTSPQKEQQQQEAQTAAAQAAAATMVPDATATQTKVPVTTMNGDLTHETPDAAAVTTGAPSDMETPAAVSEPHPVLTLSNSIATKVSFMFGVLTAVDAPPQVDAYLIKANQIVKTVLEENPNTFVSLASTVAYPVVSSIEKDLGE